jgi:hydroxymethylglutaryl-CoA lyase
MRINFKTISLIIILSPSQLFSALMLWEALPRAFPRALPTLTHCFTTHAIQPITTLRNVEIKFNEASIPFVLPGKVKITLATLRDGAQSQRKNLDLKVRANLIGQEAHIISGLAFRQEVGSCVKPSLMPTVAQPDLLIRAMIEEGMSPTAERMSILVPNQRGFEDFVKLFQTLPPEWQAALEVAFFTSACPEFLKRNTGFSSIEHHLKTAEQIAKDASRLGVLFKRAFVSMAFRSPFSEEDLTDRAFGICRELYGMGYTEVVPADTNGIASVPQVIKLFHALRKDGIPKDCLGFHGHDLGNEIEAVVASLPFVTTVDATVLGIGGCPFSPGSPGNMNVRTIKDTLGELGVDTGLQLTSHNGLNVLKSAERAFRYALNGHGVEILE